MKRNKTVHYYSVLIFWMNVCMCVCFVHIPRSYLEMYVFIFCAKIGYILFPSITKRGGSYKRDLYVNFYLFSPRKPTTGWKKRGRLSNNNCNILTLISSCDCVTNYIFIYVFFFPFFQVYLYLFPFIFVFSRFSDL